MKKQFLVFVMLYVLLLGWTPQRNAAASVAAQEEQVSASNKIAVENQLEGTEEDQILFDNRAAFHEVEGYASSWSVFPGDTLRIFVRTSNGKPSRGRIFRKGWYGGKRACAKTDWFPIDTISQVLPTPDADGWVECDWQKSYEIQIPTTWVTGIYLIKLQVDWDYPAPGQVRESFIPFVVLDPSNGSDLLMQLSFTTYLAYNPWGGVSLYHQPGISSQVAKVSANRPFGYNGNDPFHPGAGEIGRWELSMATFLERNNYDVSYCTDVETHRDSNLLLGHRAFLVVGHDEYWSREMDQNVRHGLNSGVNLAAFAANVRYWQIRFEPDAHNIADRTMVCYKGRATLPMKDGGDPFFNDGNSEHQKRVTVRWRDWPVLEPEDSLFGVMYLGQYQGTSDMSFTSGVQEVPWLFQGTGLGGGSVLSGLVGYEADTFIGIAGGPEGGHAPAGTKVLAASQISGAPSGTLSHMTVYTTESGATVFASGSMQFAWGLDRSFSTWSSAAEQLARNLLQRFLVPAPIRQNVTLNVVRHPKKGVEGEPLVVTIIVSGTESASALPTGTVELSESESTLAGSSLQNGQASISINGLTVGWHSIAVTYSGDTNYKSQSVSFDVKVKRKPS